MGKSSARKNPIKRVTGLGGVFFKSRDPAKLYEWYEKRLGVRRESNEAVVFKWRDHKNPRRVGSTVWSLFPKSTQYFQPSRADFMINYRVQDLDALLEALRGEGVKIDPHREDYEYGRFAWIMDPEGNRIELWEPPRQAKRGMAP